MFQIEKTEVVGLEAALRNVQNKKTGPSDSGICKGGDNGIGCKHCAAEGICQHDFDYSFQFGRNDYSWMMHLIRHSEDAGQIRNLIVIYVDITAPTPWWGEFIRDIPGNRVVLGKPKNISGSIWKRTLMLTYDDLVGVYRRHNNFGNSDETLNEWAEFFRWVERLPYSEFITEGGEKK